MSESPALFLSSAALAKLAVWYLWVLFNIGNTMTVANAFWTINKDAHRCHELEVTTVVIDAAGIRGESNSPPCKK